VELGRFDDAMEYFDEALEVDPNNLDALNGKDMIMNDRVNDSLDLILLVTIVGSITSVVSFFVVLFKIKENAELKAKLTMSNEQIEDLVDKMMKSMAKSK